MAVGLVRDKGEEVSAKVYSAGERGLTLGALEGSLKGQVCGHHSKSIDMQLLTKNILSSIHLDSVNSQAIHFPPGSTGNPSVPLERDGLREVKESA